MMPPTAPHLACHCERSEAIRLIYCWASMPNLHNWVNVATNRLTSCMSLVSEAKQSGLFVVGQVCPTYITTYFPLPYSLGEGINKTVTNLSDLSYINIHLPPLLAKSFIYRILLFQVCFII